MFSNLIAFKGYPLKLTIKTPLPLNSVGVYVKKMPCLKTPLTPLTPLMPKVSKVSNPKTPFKPTSHVAWHAKVSEVSTFKGVANAFLCV